MQEKYILSSSDCELLLAFENYPSLQELSEHMQRDHSVVARSLKKMSELYPVVEKKAGKWILTEIGKAINDQTRSSISMQRAILQSQASLRIGTNREFSARILGPDFRTLQELFSNTVLSISSFEKGSEQAILQGQIDIGIDCDRPFDPEISYKLILEEPIIAVASKSFMKTYKKELAANSYTSLPHLLCERLSPDKVLLKSENQYSIVARFNDIATTRAACIQDSGWALLPKCAVKEELDKGTLIQIDDKLFGKSKYGVWWPRNRSYLKPAAEKIAKWLEKKEL